MTDRIDPDTPANDQLEAILKDLADTARSTDGHTRFGQIVDAVGARGAGPLLVILGALQMLPVATIPGVPAIIGLALIGVGIQLVRASKGVWLPDRVARVQIPNDRLATSLDRVDAALEKLRPFLGKRMTWVVNRQAVRIAIGAIAVVSGAIIIAIGFVPALPFVLAIHIVLFGIALTLVDGLVCILGFLWLLPAIYTVWNLGNGTIW